MAALIYGSGADLTTSGDSYSVHRWPSATNTFIRWPSTTNSIYYNTSTAATSVEMNWIEYQTLDSNVTSYIQGPGYTVRVMRQDGQWDTTWPTIATSGNYEVYRPKTPIERLKEILHKRMASDIISTCKPLGFTTDIREIRARETLRRVLGEDKFRDFVRRGHVSVRAKSGLVYQIFPGSDFTKVYDRGIMVDRLCVVMTGGFPPTDSLIMRYLMILNNEEQFKSYAIKHGAYNSDIIPFKRDERSLNEIFKEFKKVA